MISINFPRQQTEEKKCFRISSDETATIGRQTAQPIIIKNNRTISSDRGRRGDLQISHHSIYRRKTKQKKEKKKMKVFQFALKLKAFGKQRFGAKAGWWQCNKKHQVLIFLFLKKKNLQVNDSQTCRYLGN